MLQTLILKAYGKGLLLNNSMSGDGQTFPPSSGVQKEMPGQNLRK